MASVLIVAGGASRAASRASVLTIAVAAPTAILEAVVCVGVTRMRFCDAAYPNRFPNSHISRNGSVSWQNQRRNYRRCNTFRLYAAFHYTHSIRLRYCGCRTGIYRHRRNRRKCHSADAET